MRAECIEMGSWSIAGESNRARKQVRVRLRYFVITGGYKGVLYDSFAEEGGREDASGLWLQGRLCGRVRVLVRKGSNTKGPAALTVRVRAKLKRRVPRSPSESEV